MSYQVHNFEAGDVLLASQLNEMDNQIALNESSSALKSSIANEFSISSTYTVGDYVIYEGQLYQCTTAVTTAGSWNSNNWTQAILGNDVSDLKGDVMDIEDSFPDEAYSYQTVPYEVEWEQGGVNDSGVESDSSIRIRTDYIPIGEGIVGSFSGDPAISFWVRVFDGNKALIGNGDTTDTGAVVENPSPRSGPIDVDTALIQWPNAKYVRLSARNISSASAAILPEQNSMTFTKRQRNIFVGVPLDSIYERKTRNAYSADELRFVYEIGDGKTTVGFLKLPPNYAPEGKPVPLIVFVHGSGDIGRWDATTMTSSYQTQYNFLRDSGYAVFDCYGLGSDYKGAWYVNTFGLPINNRCYLSGIRYVCKVWNIDIGNVFVACKSQGGTQAIPMLFNADMPIKAAGLLAPDVWYIDMRLGYRTVERQIVAAQLGFSEDTDNVMVFEEGDSIPAGYYPYITENMDKWCGVFGNFKGLPIEDSDKPNYYTDATAVATADMVRSTLGRPLKIWCAQDDDAVSYGAIDALCKSIRNGGGYAQLRTMPNNTGRHHSVDNAENAPQTTNVVTKCGVEYASIATAYYELVQFFDQFLTGV